MGNDSATLLALKEGWILMPMATTQVFKRKIYFRSYLEEWPDFWLTRGPMPQQPALGAELSPWGLKVRRVWFQATNCPLCTASQHIPKTGRCVG